MAILAIRASGCILLRFPIPIPENMTMLKLRSIYLLAVLIELVPGVSATEAPVPAQVPTPSEFLKFEVGADRKLADYRQISSYFKALAAASKRLEIQTQIGRAHV